MGNCFTFGPWEIVSFLACCVLSMILGYNYYRTFGPPRKWMDGK